MLRAAQPPLHKIFTGKNASRPAYKKAIYVQDICDISHITLIFLFYFSCLQDFNKLGGKICLLNFFAANQIFFFLGKKEIY